ncbi:hypothetical protein BKA80DRAFT_261368 [Phyllosticta citrichinensis]
MVGWFVVWLTGPHPRHHRHRHPQQWHFPIVQGAPAPQRRRSLVVDDDGIHHRNATPRQQRLAHSLVVLPVVLGVVRLLIQLHDLAVRRLFLTPLLLVVQLLLRLLLSLLLLLLVLASPAPPLLVLLLVLLLLLVVLLRLALLFALIVPTGRRRSKRRQRLQLLPLLSRRADDRLRLLLLLLRLRLLQAGPTSQFSLDAIERVGRIIAGPASKLGAHSRILNVRVCAALLFVA